MGNIEKPCRFCKDWPEIAENLQMQTNEDITRSFAMIANGFRQKELILSIKGTTYGVEIDFCPKCGRNLNPTLETVENSDKGRPK